MVIALERAKRKLDHIQYALQTGQLGLTGFDDISFVHQSLPGIALEQVNLATKMGELQLSSPIFINAMTGGGGKTTEDINRDLAIVAKETNIAMAVGSQMSAIRDASQLASYAIVRKENPKGIIIGNVGVEATVEQALRACDMLEADALQLHLNVIQELTMPEGDRDFSKSLANIEEISKRLHVPVIVKEVGFGMSKETIAQLASVGVSIVDVGGFGGTNFAKIENERRTKMLNYFNDWGIPTAASIVEAVSLSKDLFVIASGGVQTSLEIVKSMALGANSVGLAGYFLKMYKEQGVCGLITEIMNLQEELTYMMTALGAATIEELQQVKLVISGKTYHWLTQRGVDCSIYAK